MQERFDSYSARKAVKVFKKFIENTDLKDKIKCSNKTLILLTTLAYLGECSKTKLRKAFPGVSIDASLDDLISLGYISKVRDGKEVAYNYEFDSECSDIDLQGMSNDSLYLFANALLNISLYIRKYGITSYNQLALILEIALNNKIIENAYGKTKFDGKRFLTHLDENSIKSVNGGGSNKLMVRKQLEKMGIIKHADYSKERAYGGDFVLNKSAYIIEVK